MSSQPFQTVRSVPLTIIRPYVRGLPRVHHMPPCLDGSRCAPPSLPAHTHVAGEHISAPISPISKKIRNRGRGGRWGGGGRTLQLENIAPSPSHSQRERRNNQPFCHNSQAAPHYPPLTTSLPLLFSAELLGMERQKSPSSSKPTRTRAIFLSLTIFSPLVLCLFFYFFIFGSYPSLEKTHSPLGSLLETAVRGSFLPVSLHHLDDNAAEGDVLRGKSDLGTSHSESLSEEDSDSNLETEDFILEETHLAESADSTDEGGDFGKGGSFALPKVEARTAHFELANRSQVAQKIKEEGVESCDVFKGRWVFDESYPLYTNETCGFVDEGFSCQSNGRPDSDYMRWRWQPFDCNLPRFDAVKMLEMIRGKRLVFAGDSINRNQWEALLCMVKQSMPNPKSMYEAHGRRITKGRGVYNFKFPDYQCSIEYYVTHFLVREGKAKAGRRHVSTLRIDTIDKTSSKWRGADIIVFNTAHWWSHHKIKSGKNYFQEGDQVHPHLDVATAFRKALATWASWIDQHVDPSKTTVFFRSSSPSHYSGGEWNSGGHCRESTHPLNETTTRRSPKLNVIVDQVLNQMKTPVTILNVTAMSGLRKDGHPSIYGRNHGDSSSRSIQDCSHWCLPGVPDVWNELLYYHLLSKHRSSSADKGIL